MVAAMHPTQASAKGGDASPDEQPDTGREDSPSLEERQRADPDLAPIMDYIQTGVLPDGERTRELALTWNQYELLEGVLYHVEHDKTLRVILLKGDRKKVFNEAHTRWTIRGTPERCEDVWSASQTLLVAQDAGRCYQLESSVFVVCISTSRKSRDSTVDTDPSVRTF